MEGITTVSEAVPSFSVEYDNWCAVAGFFDGDGGLDVEVRKNTLHWVLNFTDNWPPQLAQVKNFLEANSVRVGRVRPTGVGGFKVEVAAVDSLVRCAQSMLGTTCVFKKRRELECMVNYFGGKLTGNDVIGLLNDLNPVKIKGNRLLDLFRSVFPFSSASCLA